MIAKMSILCGLTVLAPGIWVLAADTPLPGPAGLLAPGAKLETLWSEGSFTEGGALAGDGTILFSDIGDRIMRFDPATKAITVYREPSGRANGLVFDLKGRLIAAEGSNTGGGRRVSITEPDGTIRTLADRFEGKRFNSPNDVAIDAQGRVYVSDPRNRWHDRDDRRSCRRLCRLGSDRGRLCVHARREASGGDPRPRAPHERRVRRGRPDDLVHHRRQEPLSDHHHDDRVSALVPEVMSRNNAVTIAG
jgi:hypothetical protein